MCTDQLQFPEMVTMVLVSGLLVLFDLKISGLDIEDDVVYDQDVFSLLFSFIYPCTGTLESDLLS